MLDELLLKSIKTFIDLFIPSSLCLRNLYPCLLYFLIAVYSSWINLCLVNRHFTSSAYCWQKERRNRRREHDFRGFGSTHAPSSYVWNVPRLHFVVLFQVTL